MMPSLVLQKSFTVTGVSECRHISYVSSDRVGISDKSENLVLSNTLGEELYRVTDITHYVGGVHTLTSNGDLIYIDNKFNINKLSKDHNIKTILIPYNTESRHLLATLKPYKTELWTPRCVYSSPSNGDLLVGVCTVNSFPLTGKVNRYAKTGKHLQTIGKKLYKDPLYITENRNGDVIVSDGGCNAVVVTESSGRHRFSYRGPPFGLRLVINRDPLYEHPGKRSELRPRGICTDTLSHILVCDDKTSTVQILDKNGHFLSHIYTGKDGIGIPVGLSYDDRTQLLWVASRNYNTLNIYRLIHEDSLTGLPLEKMKCEKHPSGTLSKFCDPCEAALCELCITTSSDHKRHDVRDVEKLFREIHKRKDEDAVLMCLLLCQNYKINLEEEQWMEKYNAVADVFKFKKIKKKSDLNKIKKYKPVLKQDSSNIEFSCKFFRDTSFLRFAIERKFVDMFLIWAEKENIAKFCRSSNYLRREDEEEVCCWLLPNQTEQLIDRLGEEMFSHVTMKDQSIHELVYRKLGIPVQVIMRGDDSVKNFLENLKKGKTTMYHATGMLIGCAGSGKTTLLGRLKGIDMGEIGRNTRSTRGIDIQTDVFDVSNTIEVNTSDQKQRIKVRIDETSQNQTIPEPYYEEHVYENTKSLNVDVQGNNEEDIACKAANEEEMSRDSMNTETESFKEDEVAAPLFEKIEGEVEEIQTVAKNSEGLGIIRVSKQATDEPEKKISMIDFAGQCSYYSSHQIFLSPRAFFILVLNMEKNFDEMVGEEVCCQERSIYKEWTHRDYLTFWAKSIHQYSSEKAPILLVGTHAEQKTDQEKVEFFFEIWKTLETKTKSLQKHLDSKREFAIGFHENEGIEKIKESIVDVVQKLDHWGEMLPHSWAMFENFFEEKKHLKIINKRILLVFNEALPEDIKLETVADVNTMLQFFHDIREILYFCQEFLREVIILDVQWFADAFKNIITDKNHAKEDLRELTSEWDQFDDTGELSDILLCRIWKMNDNEYLEHKDEIMLYMEKLGLLAKMDDKNWYVPCMNKKSFPVNAFSSHPASSILCYTFDVLPVGIFHRLVATCMQNTSKMFSFEDRGCIYQTAAKFMFQDRHHNILMGMTQTEIQLQVFVLEGEVEVFICHKVRERIESVLHDLSSTFQENSEFHVAFKCKPVGFCDSRKSAVLSESEFSRATFQCPSCIEEKIHIVNTRDIAKYWKEIPVSTVSTPVASGEQDLGGRSRFAKLGMATNDVLNQAYRDILEMEVPPSDIESKAKATSVYKRLRPEQEHILLDAKHSGYKNFDISLLYTLIRNICSTIPKPTKGKWGDNNMPAAGEISVGDDIERIRLIRNSLTAHVSSASTPQKEFDDTWSMMSDVCQRLEAFTGKKYIDSLKGVQKLVLKEEGEDGIKAIIEKFAKDQHEQHELLKTVVSDVQELKTNMQQVKDITKYWNREQQQENLDKDGSPVNSLERRPTDKELMTVSGQIGTIFRIGIALGLDNATIQQIRIDYQNHGVKIQVFQILCEWKRVEGGRASVRKLLAAIKEFEDEVDFEKIERVFNA